MPIVTADEELTRSLLVSESDPLTEKETGAHGEKEDVASLKHP